jgi:uncharacterized protein
VVGSFVAALALFATGYAQATSFPCRHDQSSSEKLVCQDSELSSLDDKLATLYVHAKDLALDRDALEADRINQWVWRQRHCKDKACVTNWYVRRIAELEADVQQGQKAQAVSLKTSLDAQGIPQDAQQAVLEIKRAQAPSKANNQ